MLFIIHTTHRHLLPIISMELMRICLGSLSPSDADEFPIKSTEKYLSHFSFALSLLTILKFMSLTVA